MKCPVCPATDLLMTIREGIEIDYCPQCRGVWLDRGELDQMIRRATQDSLAEAQAARRDDWQERDHDRERRPHRQEGYHYGDSRGKHEHGRRKKSFLGDLFDFD